jgi:DNA-binding response OmpR family regulator
VGRGPTFTVRLPKARQVKIPAPSAIAELPRKVRVLVIDDQVLIVQAVERLFRQDGHTVFAARSGEEGLEIFERESPEVVISDLGMPSMSGWQVASAIKASAEKKGVPRPVVLVLTGWSPEGDSEKKMAEGGVDAIVQKPIHYRRLLLRLREVVEQREQSLARPQS